MGHGQASWRRRTRHGRAQVCPPGPGDDDMPLAAWDGLSAMYGMLVCIAMEVVVVMSVCTQAWSRHKAAKWEAARVVLT